MQTRVTTLLDDLTRLARDVELAAVAVSGGVDSVTLASVVHRALGEKFTAYHATSPAVPPQATERVREHAEREGWALEVVDAREFEDPQYLANPHNRCYFCKKNLYQRIAEHTSTQVFSGANKDDLGDYRPGLIAAAERQVRHPYIEVGATKEDVRAMARALGLTHVQDLPAMPCLSSRVESGIAINSDDLVFINLIERAVQAVMDVQTVRCRILKSGVKVQLDARALTQVETGAHEALRREIEAACRSSGRTFTGFEAYRQGSAFLVPAPA